MPIVPVYAQKQSKILGAALIVVWLTILSPLAVTDTYYSVYLLCGAAGLLCLWEQYRNPRPCPPGHRVWLAAFSGVFALATVLGNYALFEPLTVLEHLLEWVLCLAGGCWVGYAVLYWMDTRLPHSGAARTAAHPGRVFWCVFAGVSVVDLAYLLFARYPGVLTTDSISTLSQVMGDSRYNNMMPFWHTMTVKAFVEVGLAIFGDINAAMALFHAGQILFLAACFGYGVMTLYQAGVPRWALLAVSGVYIALPANIVYSVTMWKDVPFAAAVLLLITALYRVLRSMPGRPWIALTVGFMGMALWRTNGVGALALTVLVLFVLLRKGHGKLLGLLGGLLVLCWFLMYPLLGLMGIGQTEFQEVLSVPLQQVSRVIVQNRELTAYEQSYLQEILDFETVQQVYDPLTVDPIKYEAFRYENQDHFLANLGEYLGIYLRLGVRYPADYLKAWVDETKGYWNGGYRYWIYTFGVGDNPYGLTAAYGDNPVSHVFAAWLRYFEKLEILQPLVSIGLHAWALVACMVVLVLRRRKLALLGIPILVLLAGLWVGTPVYAEFRYAYPLMLAVPLLVPLTVFAQD